MNVDGDDVRRTSVNMDKCLDCHEIFEGHGGNRVDDPQVCVTCHVPNLSSSGRTVNLAHPEATNNLRDMLHGIHGAGVRTTAYEFVRIRGGNEYVYDWSHVEFPGEISNCETCHDAGAFELPLVDNTLVTTNVTTDGVNAAPADVTAARATVPNATDLIISPMTSSCYFCHDGEAAVAHMEQNGGAIDWPRAQYLTEKPYETCAVCHGSGKIADVMPVHGLE